MVRINRTRRLYVQPGRARCSVPGTRTGILRSRNFRTVIVLASVLALAGPGMLHAQTGAAAGRTVTTQPAPVTADPVQPGQPVDETTLVLADETAAPPVGAGSSLWPSVLRMVVVLGLVLAAIYGIYALLRRSVRPSVPDDPYLRVIASTALGMGRGLHVVQVGNQAWLVGSTDSSISAISEIHDKETIDAMALRAAESPQAPARDFGSMLTDLLGRGGSTGRKGVKGGKPMAGLVPHEDFFGRQRDRLRRF